MLSHSVLLVVGGALLTGLLGTLVFGSTSTPAERRIREEQKLLRALEAQRRIRDAQLMRQARKRAPHVQAPPRPQVEEAATAVDEDAEAERRAAEREGKRAEKERAAQLKSELAAQKRAERRQKQEAPAPAPVPPAPAPDPEPEPTEQDAPPVKPLSELPLYSWAHRIDDDDQSARPKT